MVQLEDLDDDCLIQVLERLPTRKLFKMLRVNKRWKRLATVKLQTRIEAIVLIEANRDFADCSHIYSINSDQMLFLCPMFKNDNQPLKEEPKRAIFFNMLSKCTSVKNMDFTAFKSLTAKLLLEVFERCPQLECLNLPPLVAYSSSDIEQEQWSRVLDQIGEPIIHLSINLKMDSPWLKIVALKCVNLKQIDCRVACLTTDFLEAFKMLPKTCRVSVNCSSFSGNIENLSVIEYEDVIDELSVGTLKWPSIAGRKLDRLSSLRIWDRIDWAIYSFSFRGADFAGLKRLKLDLDDQQYIQESVDCLAASRFPKLEEFCFNVCNGFNEEDFDLMFQKMSWVKKVLIYTSNSPKTVLAYFPGSAINHLKNLETIYIRITFIRESRQPKDLPEKLEQYVNGIDSLKNLTVEVRNELDGWKKKAVDKVKELKLKQNRVKINLII